MGPTHTQVFSRCSRGHACSCGLTQSRALSLPPPCPVTEHTRPSGGAGQAALSPALGGRRPLTRSLARPAGRCPAPTLGPLRSDSKPGNGDVAGGGRQDLAGRGAGVVRALGVGEAGEGSVAGGACPSTWATQRGRDRSSLRPHQPSHRFSTAKAPPRAAVGELRGRDAPASGRGSGPQAAVGHRGAPRRHDLLSCRMCTHGRQGWPEPRSPVSALHPAPRPPAPSAYPRAGMARPMRCDAGREEGARMGSCHAWPVGLGQPPLGVSVKTLSAVGTPQRLHLNQCPAALGTTALPAPLGTPRVSVLVPHRPKTEWSPETCGPSGVKGRSSSLWIRVTRGGQGHGHSSSTLRHGVRFPGTGGAL